MLSRLRASFGPQSYSASVALRLRKAANDVVYYGVLEYTKRSLLPLLPSSLASRMPASLVSKPFSSSSALSHSSSSSSNSGSASSSNTKVAKVSLMMTKAQKEELLNPPFSFLEDEVKDMSPSLAHDILDLSVYRNAILQSSLSGGQGVVGGVVGVAPPPLLLFDRPTMERHVAPLVAARVLRQAEEDDARAAAEKNKQTVARLAKGGDCWHAVYVDGTRVALFRTLEEAEQTRAFVENNKGGKKMVKAVDVCIKEVHLQ